MTAALHLFGVIVAATKPIDRDRTATMGRLFLIAVVVLLPWWGRFTYRFVRDRRRVRREEVLAARAAIEGNRTPEPDALSIVVDAIVDGADGEADPFTVTVPAAPTVERRPADAAVVELIIGDALRRSGLVVGDERVNADGSRTLRCEKVRREAR